MRNRYAIIVSKFNSEISDKLLQGALTRFSELGIEDESLSVVTVPGAVEIPLAAQLFAKSKMFSAIICLGAVIRGETDHYDYVCQQVSHGCQRVMLDFDVPVIFGLLTTDTVQQAEDRVGGTEGHKGMDAVDAAFAMIEAIDKIGGMIVYENRPNVRLI